MTSESRGLILFRRHFRSLTGGHLKVWHYLRHAEKSQVYRPGVYLAFGSRRGPENPFATDPAKIVRAWRPRDAAALFVAGLDWQAVPADVDVPVVNLVQGVRHADPGDPRRRFLARRAVRICVSPEVADAIQATGLVNGPVVTIPNGIDVEIQMPNDATPQPFDGRPAGLLVAGWKEPTRTRRVANLLRARGVNPEVIDRPLPRGEFLRRLAGAGTVVLLPLQREGCFLSALEAFALGCIVVCPDCVGNRGFCRDGDTCLVPPGDPEAIAAAGLTALALPAPDRRQIVERARAEVAKRGLETERLAFLRLLDDLPAAW